MQIEHAALYVLVCWYIHIIKYTLLHAKMAEIPKCLLGVAKEEECHKLTYTQKVGFVPFGDLDEQNNRLVELRAEITD